MHCIMKNQLLASSCLGCLRGCWSCDLGRCFADVATLQNCQEFDKTSPLLSAEVSATRPCLPPRFLPWFCLSRQKTARTGLEAWAGWVTWQNSQPCCRPSDTLYFGAAWSITGRDSDENTDIPGVVMVVVVVVVVVAVVAVVQPESSFDIYH